MVHREYAIKLSKPQKGETSSPVCRYACKCKIAKSATLVEETQPEANGVAGMGESSQDVSARLERGWVTQSKQQQKPSMRKTRPGFSGPSMVQRSDQTSMFLLASHPRFTKNIMVGLPLLSAFPIRNLASLYAKVYSHDLS